MLAGNEWYIMCLKVVALIICSMILKQNKTRTICMLENREKCNRIHIKLKMDSVTDISLEVGLINFKCTTMLFDLLEFL